MNELFHRGVAHDENPPGRGSGRFPYGSGENPGQHQFTLISEVKHLKETGLTDAIIAKMLIGPNADAIDLKAELSIAKSDLRRINHEKAVELLEKYDGNKSAVAREMGVNESVIRSYLTQIQAGRDDRYRNTAEAIRNRVDSVGYLDVGTSAELSLGVPDSTKKVAIRILEKEGYVKKTVPIKQLGTGKYTNTMILAKPGTTEADIVKHRNEAKGMVDYTPDCGKTWFVPEYPSSMSSDRIMVRYAEDGGKNMDGVIQLRRGVEDLSLGKANYAQVRIAVDGTHYMKGMAIYGDDNEFPPGIDAIYNSNKTKEYPKIGPDKDHEVLKRLKDDKDNPFGATIKAGGQYHYIDKDGNDNLSPLNKLREEGEWDSWSKTLSSQFLSKQSIEMIKERLDATVEDKRKQLNEIKSLTNPVVKQQLLEEFASNCDSNAASLSAKGFNGDAYQVILPIPSIKRDQVYAPAYRDGEQLALIRFPHGGVFEIPILTVNNSDPVGRRTIGTARDAIGVHPDVAEQLSGADFDGDTAKAIPVTRNNLKMLSRPPLEELVGFDAKLIYKNLDLPKMTDRTKQREMGEVSNLITDMTVGGANFPEIARAVKHSMVAIDAQKHSLDYKQSFRDNRIRDLKLQYQGMNANGTPKGASTILSRAKAKAYVPKYKEVTNTSIMTPEELKRWNNGDIVRRPTGEQKTKWKIITDPEKMTPDELEIYKSGRKVFRDTGKKETVIVKTKAMYTVDDAMDLVRDKSNDKEVAYANFANELKDLARESRRISRSIEPVPVNRSARTVYAKEVESLKEKLTRAKTNQPRERIAQRIANNIVSEKKKTNPELADDIEHLKREEARALTEARAMVGAKKEIIDITDREWEAIQSHAISTNRLKEIISNANPEQVKRLATPRTNSKVSKLSDAQIARIKAAMRNPNAMPGALAEQFGISVSTLYEIVDS